MGRICLWILVVFVSNFVTCDWLNPNMMCIRNMMCVRKDCLFVSILHLFVKFHKCLSSDWLKVPRSELFGLLFWTTEVGERMGSIFPVRILLCLYCAVALTFFWVGCYVYCILVSGVLFFGCSSDLRVSPLRFNNGEPIFSLTLLSRCWPLLRVLFSFSLPSIIWKWSLPLSKTTIFLEAQSHRTLLTWGASVFDAFWRRMECLDLRSIVVNWLHFYLGLVVSPDPCLWSHSSLSLQCERFNRVCCGFIALK